MQCSLMPITHCFFPLFHYLTPWFRKSISIPLGLPMTSLSLSFLGTLYLLFYFRFILWMCTTSMQKCPFSLWLKVGTTIICSLSPQIFF